MPLNVQCKRCADLRNDWCDKKHDSPDPDLIRDCQYYRTKIRADQIRAMTDEELAEFLEKVGGCGPSFDTKYCNNVNGCPEGSNCWLDWLIQEAD